MKNMFQKIKLVKIQKRCINNGVLNVQRCKSILNNSTKYYYINILDDDTILLGCVKMKCVNILIDKKI